MKPGETFIYDGHIWIVISTECPVTGFVLIVNLTTYRPGYLDDECILESEHFSWIKHRSVIAFSRAKRVKSAGFERAFKNGTFKTMQPHSIPQSTLSLILKAALKSVHLSDSFKSLL